MIIYIYLHFIEEEVRVKLSKVNIHAQIAHQLNVNNMSISNNSKYNENLNNNKIMQTSNKYNSNKRENCLFDNIDSSLLKLDEEFINKVQKYIIFANQI